MENDVIKKYEKSKSISDSVFLFAKPLVKEGAKIIDIADKIEDKIKELGGGIGFPVNISINENAAHYAPDINDDTVLKDNDLVKMDIGVHVDGYIWDRAFTMCINQKTHPLIEAAEKALKESMKIIKPGVRIFEISETVESVLEGLGFNPIRNLCGHGLDQYVTHADFSIPNGRNNIQEEIEAGQALAMEVFATDGTGWVKDSTPIVIFGYVQDKPVRMFEARKILKATRDDFNELPFAKRWLTKLNISPLKIDMSLKQLLDVEAIRDYPVLREESNGLVAQAEETIILSD